MEYNTARVFYSDLLKVFWQIHDPTQLNRQGNDVGNQYRSAIFYCNKKQKILAERSKKQLELSSLFGGKKVVTEILPATKFWPAEEYHQQYLQKNPGAYCHINLMSFKKSMILEHLV